MYYICGISFYNGRINLECFLCEPILYYEEAIRRFDKAKKYTDGLIAGLFDSNLGKWLKVVYNYVENNQLRNSFNEKNFGPKYRNYPIANVDV